MLRKREPKLSHADRLKKNILTQQLMLLDRCSQISKDDNILLRNILKDQDNDDRGKIIDLLQAYKKAVDLLPLQIQLRKVLAKIKNKNMNSFDFILKTNQKNSSRISTVTCTQRQNNHNTRFAPEEKSINFYKYELEQKLIEYAGEQESVKQIQKRIEEEIDREIFNEYEQLEQQTFQIKAQQHLMNENDESSLFDVSRINAIEDVSKSKQTKKEIYQNLPNNISNNNTERSKQNIQQHAKYDYFQRTGNIFCNKNSNGKKRKNDKALTECSDVIKPFVPEQLRVLKQNAGKWYQEYLQKYERPKLTPKPREVFQELKHSINNQEVSPKYGQFYNRLKRQLDLE